MEYLKLLDRIISIFEFINTPTDDISSEFYRAGNKYLEGGEVDQDKKYIKLYNKLIKRKDIQKYLLLKSHHGYGNKRIREIIQNDKCDEPPRAAEKISRDVAEDIFRDIKKIYPEAEMLGSYIRGEQLINDIDILVVSRYDPAINIGDILSKPRGEHGMLIINYLHNGVYCRVDILFVDAANLICSKLYFTGSKIFNILLRARAKSRGYKLDQYNFTKHDKKINIRAEADIFRELDVRYIPPNER